MDQLKERLAKLLTEAFSHVGTKTADTDVGNGVVLMLRVSRCPWPVEIAGEVKWVKTIDVVRIHSKYSLDYRNWTGLELNIKDMPRGLGAPIYKILEQLCRQYGRALRIESVISDRLRSHYIENHGFKLQGLLGITNPFENTVIKVFDAQACLSAVQPAKSLEPSDLIRSLN